MPPDHRHRGARRALRNALPFEAARVGELPTDPGVYLLRSANGEILYVGKAKSLRHRVRSYLSQAKGIPLRIRELVRRTIAVETLVVGSEAEALILEANLIKEHQPRFNLQLRDDKRYPCIRVTVAEPFPRIHLTRRLRQDGSRYFGPYTGVGRVRAALEILLRNHGIRSCRYHLPREKPARPCLDHHIGRCAAPCAGLQSEEDYREQVKRVIRALSGEVGALQAEAEEEMRSAAAVMDFERAASWRDVIAGLDGIAKQQRVQRVGGGDQDVIGLARDGMLAVATTLRIRGGVLIGRDHHTITGAEESPARELLARAVAHIWLSGGRDPGDALPREILLPGDFADRALVEEILAERAGRRVALHTPQRGAKVRLVELANANARRALDEQVRQGGGPRPGADDALYEIQERLRLKVVPRLIVCFDISHTQGTEVVAGAVTFLNGAPVKSGYRHMRIRGGWGNDDYRSMQEAVGRHLDRLEREGERLPDLVVVDGGKGQLGAADAAVGELGIDGIALAALAKREETVFVPGDGAGIRIPRAAPALHLLQRIRDEAHRFALRYNRKLRSRRTVRSRLGEIPGIGPRRQQTLLSRFGSVRGVREASAAEIGRVPGFSEAMGARILDFLKGPPG